MTLFVVSKAGAHLFVSLLLLCALSRSANASTAKFQAWFPLLSKGTYENTSTQACASTLALYYTSLQGNDKFEQAATCSHQQNCVLEGLREDIKSRMSSASVLLGLTPGLLASIGPSVAETSVLATQSPLLSFLISLACPAVYPSRVFEYEDAREILRKETFQPISDIHNRNPALGLTFKVGKYLSLFIAIINVFYTSWELGTKTVVSWRCVNYTLPLIWSILPVAIHLFASTAFYTHRRHCRSSENSMTEYNQIEASRSSNSMPQDHFLLGLQHRNSALNDRVKPTNRSIVLQYIASFLGFVHILFGIMIFSSLLFIETVDVVAVILRYLASVLVARSILMFELDHVRRRCTEQQRSSDYKRQLPPQTEFQPVSTLLRTQSEEEWKIARKPVPTAQVGERYRML